MAASVFLAPNPILQFFNNAGQPNAGGSILTQVGGVNYPTYQDSGGTTPLPNPIPLNSRGEISNTSGISCQLFLVAGVTYVFTQYDAKGNQINQASYVGNNSLLTGVFVNVLTYGADPTGVRDSTANFSAAAAVVGANGNVYVPAGTYLLSGNPSPSVTWLIDSGASFTGAGSLCVPANAPNGGRTFKYGNGGVHAHGTKLGAQSAWLEALRTPTESISDLIVLSSIGQIGIIGGSQTTDSQQVGSQGCIGLVGYSNNNNTGAIQTSYAGYLESRRQVGAGITQGLEIDIVNLGDTGFVYPGNMYPGNNMSNALWLASGGGVAGAQGASLALGIVANGNNFDKGIAIQTGAVQVYSGEAVAIALGYQNGIVWYDSGTNKVARIRSDATAASIGIVFSNDAMNLQTMTGTTMFTFQDTGVLNINTLTGGYWFYGVQVVGARIGGWGTSSGGARGPITGAATLPQVAAALSQLLTDLATHGLIGT